MLDICEIFHSIQGESSYAGWPCVFVRLSGCNLRCSYCDTKYAYEEGEAAAILEIVKRVQGFRCPLVEVTGGEPLMQEKTPELIRRLLYLEFVVLLETNGSLDISMADDRCVKIVDFKGPSSGEENSNDLANIERLNPHDEVKLVIGSRDDFEHAKYIEELIHCVPSRRNVVHFSPVYGKLGPRELAEWILADGLNVRLNLQLHKHIWDPRQRGV